MSALLPHDLALHDPQGGRDVEQRMLALAESIARAGSVDAAMACETEPA